VLVVGVCIVIVVLVGVVGDWLFDEFMDGVLGVIYLFFVFYVVVDFLFDIIVLCMLCVCVCVVFVVVEFFIVIDLLMCE